MSKQYSYKVEDGRNKYPVWGELQIHGDLSSGRSGSKLKEQVLE
jgi:hypothetical protein